MLYLTPLLDMFRLFFTTALLEYIVLQTNPLNADPETLLRALFLAQLPTEVRQILAGSAKTDLDELATDADRIMEASQTSSLPGISGVDTTRRGNTLKTTVLETHKKLQTT